MKTDHRLTIQHPQKVSIRWNPRFRRQYFQTRQNLSDACVMRASHGCVLQNALDFWSIHTCPGSGMQRDDKDSACLKQ
jgi:hypothetical protein